MIVTSTPKKKKFYVKPKPEDFEEAEKAEHEGETEDIYNTKERETMLEDDEITDAEEGFMVGRDEPPNKKETRKKSHDDDTSGRLAEEDAQED